MSKRYREVLEEVETPRSRAEDHAASGTATAAAAAADDVIPLAGADADAGAGAGAGGVATLVRPTAVAEPSAASGTGHLAPRPGPRRPAHGAPRPGNGPADAEEPLAFDWRGRHYEVTRVLGHWREEEGWWRRPDGEPIRIEQSDLWRVEATRDVGSGIGTGACTGVYELARRGTTWRLDRVWD